MENHTALESSFCLVAEHQFTDIKFSADAVIRASELCLNASRQAVLKVSEKLTYQEGTKEEIKELYDSFFGELKNSHPFHFANQIGFDATEPQITKGIAYFIDPEIQGDIGTRRLKAFLMALLDDQPQNSSLLESISSPVSYAYQIKAEFPIRGRRADIYISWKENDELFGVMVEVKFNHCVTAKQLPTYKGYLSKVIKNGDNSALILLTYSGEKAPVPNKGWQPKSWLAVMSKWEKNLKGDHEVGFSFLRQFIWNKLR